ncbi:MAG TPA: hypothetical protein VLZ89_12265 [Anaerolineales bacterium]|nr:hypothetical protein [Anaerolineales bacterium]
MFNIVNPQFLNIIHCAKSFIGYMDLVAGIPGDFEQNPGLGRFLDILSGGRDGPGCAFRRLNNELTPNSWL